MQRHPRATTYFVEGNGQVAIAPRPPDAPDRERVDAAVTTHAILVPWVRQFLACDQALNAFSREWYTRFAPYHAAYNWRETFPLIWPADAGYARQLAYV
jgi:hypothetical protein